MKTVHLNVLCIDFSQRCLKVDVSFQSTDLFAWPKESPIIFTLRGGVGRLLLDINPYFTKYAFTSLLIVFARGDCLAWFIAGNDKVIGCS